VVGDDGLWDPGLEFSIVTKIVCNNGHRGWFKTDTDISKQRTTLDGQSCLYKAKVTNAQEMASMVKTKVLTIPVVHFMYHLSPSALGPAAQRQKTSARATHYLAQRSTCIFTTITSSVQG
jgi:hypothetical protein